MHVVLGLIFSMGFHLPALPSLDPAVKPYQFITVHDRVSFEPSASHISRLFEIVLLLLVEQTGRPSLAAE